MGMTAPVLTQKKFWIVKPKAGRNELWNPRFDPPEGVTYWTGTNASLSLSGDETRRNAYSMKVTPVSGVAGTAYYNRGLKVTNGLKYTFSCDVKGVAGQPMRIVIATSTGTARATKTFTATGYWQRMEVTLSATESVTNYRVQVTRDAVSSTLPFYVDGVQFEQTDKATTFISGWEGDGYSWEGEPKKSASLRVADCKTGGDLLDLEDYCQLVQVTGLGHGDWNQILTKMTSGGDLYQGHIRKSRQFSIIVDFIGDTLGEIEANRKAIIDAIRPDLFEGEMVVRYQGFDDNGYEATNPIDIICIPLPATLTDTPDLPSHQRAVLNFAIPSGLVDGAYREGGELDLYAEFAADYIVRRDPEGRWCEWTGSSYVNPLAGVNGSISDIKEAPNGDIYICGLFTSAGGVANTKCIARWSKANQVWQAVGNPVTGATINSIYTMAFDANGDLYVGGNFTNLAGIANADYFAKYTVSTNTWRALGSGINYIVWAIEISPNGTIYIGGEFTSASGNANCKYLAYWNGTVWDDFCTWGSTAAVVRVNALKFHPNGHLIIGGNFGNAKDDGGDWICYWDGVNAALQSFEDLGATGLNGSVRTIDINPNGTIIIGGDFTNAGGDSNADYVAAWRGNNWGALMAGGVNNYVTDVYCASNGDIYISGAFTAAGYMKVADKIVKSVQGAYQRLDIDLPGVGETNAICEASDGSLYLGGAFSTTASGENAISSNTAIDINVSSGSADTYPRMIIIGPGNLYSITNYSTGAQIAFNDLTLLAGEVISFNFDPLNLKFTSSWDGRGSVLRYVNAGSDYGNFYLKPGYNTISVFMDKSTTTAATNAWIAWKPRFWGIDGALL
jgi:hypothetical protein